MASPATAVRLRPQKLAVHLEPYVVDTLMPDLVGHDRHPAAFLVYLLLWSRTGGPDGDPAQVTLTELAEGTGLSKRSVQGALNRLVRRELVTVHRASITAIGEYRVRRSWRASSR